MTTAYAPLVTERYKFDPDFARALKSMPVKWGFGSFSEAVYYRTYSRLKDDGTQERWADTVLRVISGCISIRKDWYIKHGLYWDDAKWSRIAERMAYAVFEMKFLPPGRGLWAGGTDFIYERGSAALNNCAYVDVIDDLGKAAAWAMDMLMCGCGVGFSTDNAFLPKFLGPDYLHEYTFVVPDSREGWCEGLHHLIDSYRYHLPYVRFDYSKIRPAGSPIRGFGGVSSGAEPLQVLYDQVRGFLDQYIEGSTSQTRLITDVFNAIGCCVVAGNVRRSAELASGSIYDDEFLNLKNYQMFPERAAIGWMSNNSVVLKESTDFERLPQLAERIRDNGEPGIINLINIQKYGRIGKKKLDLATGTNPCSEIALESYELCNLVEVFPTRCDSLFEIWDVMELATLYASTIALLPSHSPETNAVISRNRRIGVSVSGIADWIDATSLSHVTMALRDGYEKVVEPTNRRLAQEAGVPASVRLTTVKPSGTISLLAGVSPGMHWPVFTYGIRRMRVSDSSPLAQTLIDAGVPHEPDVYSANTLVFEFPMQSGSGKTRSVEDVSIWEQASLVAMLQREWADNAVSNTLNFMPAEASQIERVIAAFAPVIKSISLLPTETHGYAQAPYEKTTKAEYLKRVADIKPIDWSLFTGSDGIDSKYCANDQCEI
jgi:ribonucleoside-triphosphate reductase (thioredoxin)